MRQLLLVGVALRNSRLQFLFGLPRAHMKAGTVPPLGCSAIVADRPTADLRPSSQFARKLVFVPSPAVLHHDPLGLARGATGHQIAQVQDPIKETNHAIPVDDPARSRASSS